VVLDQTVVKSVGRVELVSLLSSLGQSAARSVRWHLFHLVDNYVATQQLESPPPLVVSAGRIVPFLNIRDQRTSVTGGSLHFAWFMVVMDASFFDIPIPFDGSIETHVSKL